MSGWTQSAPVAGTAPHGNSARSEAGSAFFAQFSSSRFRSAVTVTPAVASAIAGAETAAHDSEPNRIRASSRPAATAGTVIDRYPVA